MFIKYNMYDCTTELPNFVIFVIFATAVMEPPNKFQQEVLAGQDAALPKVYQIDQAH